MLNGIFSIKHKIHPEKCEGMKIKGFITVRENASTYGILWSSKPNNKTG